MAFVLRCRFLTVLILVAGLSGLLGCSNAVELDDSSGRPSPAGTLHEEKLVETMSGLIFTDDRVRVDPDWQARSYGEEAAREYVTIGEKAMQQGSRLTALRSFADAIIAAPWSSTGYQRLGRMLVVLRRYDHAIAAYMTALDIDSTLINLRFNAANALQNNNRLDEAIEQWLRVVSQTPEHGRAHARLTAGFFLQAQYAKARDHLVHAQALGAAVPSQIAAVLTTGAVPRAVVHQADIDIDPGTGLVTIGPQVRIDVNGGTAAAHETTIAVASTSSGEVVAGWNDWRQGNVRAGVGVSLDSGATWTDFLLRPPAQYYADIEGDPMTGYDRRTGTLWAGGVSYYTGGIYVARLQPGTTTFETPIMLNPTTDFVDKPWMGTGPQPGVPDSTRLFVAYHPHLQYSDDFGQTWSTPVSLDYGFGHLPRVSPSGEVTVAYWDVAYGIKFQQSLDGGDSIGSPVQIATRIDTDVYGNSYPGQFRVWPFTYLAIDPSTGTMYCVWHDVTGVSGGNNNVDLLFVRSDDQGETWTSPVVINSDSDPAGDQFFPWLEVDERGWLHMMFLDTRHTLQNDNASSAWLDAYYSLSKDGGETWTEYRLTPTSINDNGASFMGDYCGLTVVGDHVYPVYPSMQNGSYDVFTHTIICVSASVFEDGFETGDTSEWSSTIGF